MRVAGVIRFLGDQPLPAELVRSYVAEVLGERGEREFNEHGATDTAVALPGVGRFRCNAFHQCGETGLVLRAIKGEIPSFKDLNLPVEPLKRLSSLKRGLVLATGIAGSGKSTTLASMLEYVNRTMNKHIVTVEDPVEFRFEDKRSIVNQREIGTDVSSFPQALRQSLRQSPDVILIGEMRDAETVSAAISAAETGHLVFSTLHTVNAVRRSAARTTGWQRCCTDLLLTPSHPTPEQEVCCGKYCSKKGSKSSVRRPVPAGCFW